MEVGINYKRISTLADLRRDLPFTKEVGYFQTGTYGPTPDSVVQVVASAMRFEANHGPATSTSREAMREPEERARRALAALLNVKHRELALTTNTSQAMQRVMRALEWRPGDEFIVSSLEHVSTTGISWELERKHQVKVITLTADQGDAVFLEGVKSALSPRTRLICLSEIASADGRRLPVAETCALAHEKNVSVVVDGAQAVGQVPVDIRALGCDYYVGSGHKWLLGPMGTGFVYASEDHLGAFNPDYVPERHPWTVPGTPAQEPSARSRAEIGTYNHALVIGLGASVDIMASIGLSAIEARAAQLSKRFRDGLLEIPGVKILTPLEPGTSAGITSFMIQGYDRARMEYLSTNLWDKQRVVVKAQWLTAPPRAELVAVRVSIAGFNSEDEVDRLVEGLREEIAG